MKVKELKRRLSDVMNRLDECDDEQEVRMVSNTYFLGSCSTFIGISGYDGGYINCDRMVEEEEYCEVDIEEE